MREIIRGAVMKDEAFEVVPIDLKFVKAFLIKGEENILVDTGNPGQADDIVEKIRGEGVEPKDIENIIITHVHPDHAGSLPELKERTGAGVVVHEREAGYIKRGDFLDAPPNGLKGRFMSFFLSAFSGENQLDGTVPDMPVNDGFDLRDIGVPGTIIHTPGHTPGSISIMLNNGEAIIGDLVMGGILRPSHPCEPMFAYDLEEAKKSIKKILKDYDIKSIHASHGGPFSFEEVKSIL